MRLFVGLAITDEIRENITNYVTKLREQVPETSSKWVKPESYHVTLKFIGERQRCDEIERQLGQIKAPPIALEFKGVGFFTPRSPRIFWAGVNAGPELEKLAGDLEARLQIVEVPKEPHAYAEYQPHLTLARAGSGRPQGSVHSLNRPVHSTMSTLKDLVALQPAPAFGTMTANEFVLYQSEALPGGARYKQLAHFALSLPPDA